MKGTSKRAELRLSQLITTFGPGAMVDLPTRSVIVGGLERWDMRDGGWKTINEPRISQMLEVQLRGQKRLADDQRLTLRTPPLDPQIPGREPPGIDATIFPCWFVTESQVQTPTGRRRRLVPWTQLDIAGGRRQFTMDDGKKSEITPIRFVAACEKGHIQDIDWAFEVHRGKRCGEALFLEEQGTTGDPRNTRIVCGCNASLSLSEAQIPERFGSCRGKQPWLSEDDPEGCTKKLRFLTRTATNAYFSQVLTVISLPSAEDELTRQIDRNADAFGDLDGIDELKVVLKSNPGAKAAVDGYAIDAVWAKIAGRKTRAAQNLDKKPRYAEFDLLASGTRLIGEDGPSAELHAETLERSEWGDADRVYAPIHSVVAVHRLREVSCLYGFTRFEAAPATIDGDLEEVFLAVDGAALTSDLSWLPAVEQFGEGMFLRFDPQALARWYAAPAVRARDADLRAAFDSWAATRFEARKPPAYPGATYTLLHSFSHALMAEIALDCGYPASALKERIYALIDEVGRAGADESSGSGRFGILIYTAAAGSQGTLGGLIGVIPRLAVIIARTIERLTLCSNDPICADHQPKSHIDDRALHGAACHSCLLIAETSCEHRNLHLDRALVTDTVAASGCGLFQA